MIHMSQYRSHISAFVLILAGLALAACGTYDKVMGRNDPPPPPCPQVSVVQEALSLTRFRPGPGRDLTDVLFEAKLDDFQGGCEFEYNRKTRHGVQTVDLNLLFEAARGPADTGREARFEYFVTLVNEQKQVVTKQVYPIKVTFPGNLTRARVTTEPVFLHIPVKGKWTGKEFEAFIGLQLSQAELDHNRRRNKAGR